MLRRRALAAIAAGALAPACGGCYAGHLFAWAFAPRHPKQAVKAEYQLDAERLVIVPYAGTDILFAYPTAPLEISRDLIYAFSRNLGARIRSYVNPVEVIRWQESNLEWPNMTLPDIARHFGADALLYVELERYTMIEERSANLFRGRVRARIQVVKPEAIRNPVYETTVETTFPEDRPVGVLETSERQIRAGTTTMFARAVVRKFCDHEIEIRGGRP